MMSCIIAVMDRDVALREMLPTWTNIDKIKDFVIVDWSSKTPIIEDDVVQSEMLKNKNIKIIRVENQKYFYRCLAWNLAFQNTNPENKILLKLDADYMNINANWMNRLAIQDDLSLDNYFITGDPRFKYQYTGFLLVNKRDFGSGYNEQLPPTYGSEDFLLYNKLKLAPPKPYASTHNPYPHLVTHIPFFNIEEYIYHIDHSDYSRAINSPMRNLFDLKTAKPSDYLPSVNFKFIISKEESIKKYKILTESENYTRVEAI